MEQALKRLKVKPERLAAAPQITPLFKNAEGGLKAVLRAMRFSAQDDVIAAFLKKYESVPVGDRNSLPWEAIALSAGLDMHHLTGAILFALQAASVNAVKIIALTAHPAVMQKTVEFAKLPSGEKDRKIMHQGLGFLPSPKGPTFIGKAVFAGQGAPEKEEPEQTATFGENDDIDQLFPSVTAMQDKLIPIRQRLLE